MVRTDYYRQEGFHRSGILSSFPRRNDPAYSHLHDMLQEVRQVRVEEVAWAPWAASFHGSREGSPSGVTTAFPENETVPACRDCLAHMKRGVLSPAAQIHLCLGCEHAYPDELEGPDTSRGEAHCTEFMLWIYHQVQHPGGRGWAVGYPKHVKGHITVFPNNVQELVTNVLPHPLLKVMDEIHVSWHGLEKPTPRDLSILLSVRRCVVEKALLWLKRNSPLYAGIQIDTAEMDSWSASMYGVPHQIYARLERNEPSGREKARTGQLVPAAERGLEEDRPRDIREVMAELQESERGLAAPEQTDEGDQCCMESEAADDERERVHEISSSGMFPLDAPSGVGDAERLQRVCEFRRARCGHSVFGEGRWRAAAIGAGAGHAHSRALHCRFSGSGVCRLL